MQKILNFLKNSHSQTKFFILMVAIYMIALFWTTLQAYMRLEYSRSDRSTPIIIRIPSPQDPS